MRVRWAVLASYPRNEPNGFLGFSGACFNRVIFASLPSYLVVAITLGLDPEPEDTPTWALRPVVTGPDLRPISNFECLFPQPEPPTGKAIIQPRLKFSVLQAGVYRIAWRSGDAREDQAPTSLWVSTPVTPIVPGPAQARTWGSTL
jgi:hypothetical protein